MTPTCWVCGSASSVRWRDRSWDRPLTPDDLRITDARYGTTLALRRCAECGFGFSDDDELDRLLELYEALEDSGYEDSQEPRALQMRWLVDTATRLRPHARSALDVGAGTGLLVAAAAAAGLEAVGVEPSRSLVAVATAQGTRVLQGALPHPELEHTHFDLVFLIDVIEHVPDPVGLLRATVARLAPGGLLVVVTPDAGSSVARRLGRRWWHLRLAHVGYFTAESLDRAAAAVGLRPVHRDRARWFFQVGYLAERVASYLPVRWLNRFVTRWAAGRWLYDRVIRLNLHDSLVVAYEPAPGRDP